MFRMDKLVLDIVMVLSTMWMTARYWSVFYERKEKNIGLILNWGALAACQFALEYYSGKLQIVLSLINAILILLVAVLGYYSKGKEKYLLLILYYTVGVLIEMLVFFLLKYLKIPSGQFSMMGSILSKIISIILIYTVSIIWSKKRNYFIAARYFILLLFVPIGSCYLAIVEFYFNYDTVLTTLTLSFLLLFNLIIFEIYMKLNEAYNLINEKTIYSQQLAYISKNTDEQKRMMENFKEQKHNLVNVLITVKYELEKGNLEAASQNLSRIISNFEMIDMVSNSGNNVVDAVINFKYSIAKEAGILFHVRVFVPEEMPIEQCDIGVVLGNALDNAIEAVKGCTQNEKVIEISIGVRKEALIIVVKNPYEHQLEQDYLGNLVSTKKESHMHGFGLSSIKKIVEKYEGEVIVDCEQQIFVLTIVMNFK